MKLKWLAAGVWVLGAAPALAHPHLFSTMKTTVMVAADGNITGLRLNWRFDETYTKYSLEGLDLNNNGTYEPEEIQPLTDENIKNLVESSYFTMARQNGKTIEQAPVKIYGQELSDNRLTLWFELPFKTPVDVKQGAFQVLVYDPDFFIAFDYDQASPTALEGVLPQGCGMELQPVPSTEELAQTKQYLADKPQDWQPDQPTDFGAMFAQPLVMSCK